MEIILHYRGNPVSFPPYTYIEHPLHHRKNLSVDAEIIQHACLTISGTMKAIESHMKCSRTWKASNIQRQF